MYFSKNFCSLFCIILRIMPIHCTTKKEAHEVAETIQKQVDVAEYMILFSLREFKKIRVEYFMEDREDF